MPQKLMDVLRLGRCSHEFSWPRRADDGEYYQVCLLCAAEYKYDWKTMRRIERLERSATETARPKRRTHTQKPVWVPRARRLKFETAVRYRVKNLVGWYPGRTENLSQSGVLFHGTKPLPQNTLVEMRFEMPEEISGQKNSSVLCQGRVVRLKNKKTSAESEDGALLAAFILDYKFIH
jgi:PilZ domain